MMLVGRVVTGSGDLARWMTLYADAYAAIVGVPLHPGSLNLVLEEPWAFRPRVGITVSAEAVGCVIYLVPRSVGPRQCFIFRTVRAEQAGGDKHRVLEILSDVRLRDELGLDDGDTIEVVIDDPVGS